MNNEYVIIHGELYHFGVPGMKWGVRKAKLQAKADAYRKAASSTNNANKAIKLTSKANKYSQKADALDTKKGRAAYTAKRAVLIGGTTVAAALATGFGIKKLSELNFKESKKSYIKGLKQGLDTGMNNAFDFVDAAKGKKLGTTESKVFKNPSKTGISSVEQYVSDIVKQLDDDFVYDLVKDW